MAFSKNAEAFPGLERWSAEVACRAASRPKRKKGTKGKGGDAGVTKEGVEKAASWALLAFNDVAQEQKLRDFIANEMHQIHHAPAMDGPSKPGRKKGHYEGDETTKGEKLMLLAADAFMEAGGLGSLFSQAPQKKLPPKPLPMKQASNGLRHLTHQEMTTLKCQEFNQDQCEQRFRKSFTQYPLKVVRGMDYMYNLHQAKAVKRQGDVEGDDDDPDEEAHEASARRQEIEEKLRKSTFFRDMERQKKGIIQKLAKVSRIRRECCGQVIFRQGDQAAGAYLLCSGQAAVLVQKASKVETPRPKLQDLKNLPTLTQARLEAQKAAEVRPDAWGDRSPTSPMSSQAQEVLSRPELARGRGSQSGSTPSGMAAKVREKIQKKQKILLRDVSREEATSTQAVYATVEGTNSFNEESKLGAQVNVIEAGSVFGEVALLSDAPRSASIKCLEDCELVAVKAATFRKVLAEFMDVARATGILQSVEIFNKLEERTPGIIHTLAKSAEFTSEVKGQVIFRQGDPGKSCFMLVKGQVTVHVRKGAKGYNQPPTPRSGGGELPTLTEWRRTGLEAFDAASRQEQSFRTTEGFSSFSKESDYGDMVNWLRVGTLFGELALQNTEPRNATIMCSQDCELLRLRKEDYLSAIQGSKQKIYFFDRFLLPFRENADKRAQGAMTQHPSLLFADEIFRDGQTITTQGVIAEPKIFVLGASARAEFCRYQNSGDNPAYFLSKRPQSAPNQKANRCRALLRDDLERCRHDQELRHCAAVFPTEEEMEVCHVLKEGGIFGTLAAVANVGPEPFSIVARCPDESCTIYTLDGAGMQKIHPKLLEALRDLIAEDNALRTRRLQKDPLIQMVERKNFHF